MIVKKYFTTGLLFCLAVGALFIHLSIIWGWYIIILCPFILFLIMRYFAIKHYKKMRDTSNINTPYGQAMIKACNKKIDALNGIDNKGNIFKRILNLFRNG